MKGFVKANSLMRSSIIEGGYGNGYVVLPTTHKYHGFHYDDIPVNVHGGLTFSQEATPELIKEWSQLTSADAGAWVIGFDTFHYGDNNQTWPKARVEKEVEDLIQQLK